MISDVDGTPISLEDPLLMTKIEDGLDNLQSTVGVSTRVMTDAHIFSRFGGDGLVKMLSLRELGAMSNYIAKMMMGNNMNYDNLEEAMFTLIANVELPAKHEDVHKHIFGFMLSKSKNKDEVKYPSDTVKNQFIFEESGTLDGEQYWGSFKEPLLDRSPDGGGTISTKFDSALTDTREEIKLSWNKILEILRTTQKNNLTPAEILLARNVISYIGLLCLTTYQLAWKNPTGIHQCLAGRLRVHLAQTYSLTNFARFGVLVNPRWLKLCMILITDKSVFPKYMITACYLTKMLSETITKRNLYSESKKDIQAIIFPTYLTRASCHGQGLYKNFDFISKKSSVPILESMATVNASSYQNKMLALMNGIILNIEGYNMIDQLKNFSGGWFSDSALHPLMDLILPEEKVIRGWGWLYGRVLDDSYLGFTRPEFIPVLYVATCFIMAALDSKKGIADSVGFKRYGQLCESVAGPIADAWLDKYVTGGEIKPADKIPLKYKQLNIDITNAAKRQQALNQERPVSYMQKFGLKVNQSSRSNVRELSGQNYSSEFDNDLEVDPPALPKPIYSRTQTQGVQSPKRVQYNPQVFVPQSSSQVQQPMTSYQQELLDGYVDDDEEDEDDFQYGGEDDEHIHPVNLADI